MTTPAPASREAASSIPYARGLLALELSQLAILRRTVELLFQTAHRAAYQARVDDAADEAARHRPSGFGVFMGYDFHLTASGPRLIEINTNAGGALLNGLHTASLCRPADLEWLCCDPRPVSEVEREIVEHFRAELRAVRGDDACLRRVAIVDDRPEEQFLRAEFDLFVALFARHGIAASIVDTARLETTADGTIAVGRDPVDLIYWRDTDFQLASPRAATLRRAYLEGRVAVTPSPREHHLLADKRRLEIFSSASSLEALGLPAEDAAFLAEIVPETRPLQALGREGAWRTRSDWVFKPAAAYGSKAVYRGDKISRRRFEEVYADPRFLAQRRVEPDTTTVETAGGPRRMKFDVRAYAYRDRIFLLGARVYEGQVTNFRSPGGGFSAICVTRDRAAER